jgi:hypothetical protein
VGQFNGTSRPMWAADLGYDGTHSIKVTTASATTVNTGLTNKGPAIPTTTGAGTLYSGSVWVRTTTPNQKINLVISESGHATGSARSSLTINDSSWHQLTTRYTSLAAGDPLKFAVYISAMPTSASFNADLFSLVVPG